MIQRHVDKLVLAILIAREFTLFHIPNNLLDICLAEHVSRHAEVRSGHLSVGPYILTCSASAVSFWFSLEVVSGKLVLFLIGDICSA